MDIIPKVVYNGQNCNKQTILNNCYKEENSVVMATVHVSSIFPYIYIYIFMLCDFYTYFKIVLLFYQHLFLPILV